MIAWLKDIFGGPQGKTALVAVHASAGVAAFLGLEGYHTVIARHAFDAAGFAGAWVMVLGSSAAAIGGHAWAVSKAQANVPGASE